MLWHLCQSWPIWIQGLMQQMYTMDDPTTTSRHHIPPWEMDTANPQEVRMWLIWRCYWVPNAMVPLPDMFHVPIRTHVTMGHHGWNCNIPNVQLSYLRQGCNCPTTGPQNLGNRWDMWWIWRFLLCPRYYCTLVRLGRCTHKVSYNHGISWVGL